MRMMQPTIMMIAALMLAGCSEQAPPTPVYTLDPGEKLVISMKSEKTQLVRFGVRKNSESQKDARDCPDHVGQNGTAVRLCGGLRDLLADSDYATDVKSQFNGAAVIRPIEGRIEVELESFAHKRMEFTVVFRDA